MSDRTTKQLAAEARLLKTDEERRTWAAELSDTEYEALLQHVNGLIKELRETESEEVKT